MPDHTHRLVLMGSCVFVAKSKKLSSLLPLPGFQSQPGHVRKLPVTWDGFLQCFQLASHYLPAIWQKKVAIIEIAKKL